MRFSKVFFRKLQSFIGKMGEDSRMNMVIESWLLREPLWYFEALWKLGWIYIACKQMMCLKTSSQAATCDIRIHACKCFTPMLKCNILHPSAGCIQEYVDIVHAKDSTGRP